MLTDVICADSFTDYPWKPAGGVPSDAETEFVMATEAALAAGERRFDSPDDPAAVADYQHAMERERRAAVALAAWRQRGALSAELRSQRV